MHLGLCSDLRRLWYHKQRHPGLVITRISCTSQWFRNVLSGQNLLPNILLTWTLPLRGDSRPPVLLTANSSSHSPPTSWDSSWCNTSTIFCPNSYNLPTIPLMNKRPALYDPSHLFPPWRYLERQVYIHTITLAAFKTQSHCNSTRSGYTTEKHMEHSNVPVSKNHVKISPVFLNPQTVLGYPCFQEIILHLI